MSERLALIKPSPKPDYDANSEERYKAKGHARVRRLIGQCVESSASNQPHLALYITTQKHSARTFPSRPFMGVETFVLSITSRCRLRPRGDPHGTPHINVHRHTAELFSTFKRVVFTLLSGRPLAFEFVSILYEGKMRSPPSAHRLVL